MQTKGGKFMYGNRKVPPISRKATFSASTSYMCEQPWRSTTRACTYVSPKSDSTGCVK